jgi:hypothetical protein
MNNAKHSALERGNRSVGMEGPLVIPQRWLDHERLIMNLYAQPYPESKLMHPRGTSLWAEIQEFAHRFVVDNHVPWEQYARQRQHSRIAFIVGTTVLNECPKLLHVFEGAHGHRKAYRNVFHFNAEISEVTEPGHIVTGTLYLDRLDDALLSLYDREKLTSIGDFDSVSGFRKPKEEPSTELERLRRIIRAELLQRLGVRAGCPLPMGLPQLIQTSARKSFKDYRISCSVARMCLALLLIQERKARGRFESMGSANAFSDAGLLKDALFFKASILSQDQGVRQMASFCGVTVRRDLHVT